ncbi:MAG: aminotransferase class I/II-fold pyridoxal phosphate-dependent enzyme [Candidatus Ancillula sp.]|jgi:histidinol-phosphate aminotransferase|nr:aminotransferase class I/II-fold pyridoxal phosphate-dependent enzyme [Candidatus Ancillula sp.]
MNISNRRISKHLSLRNDLVGLLPYESFDTPVPVRLNTNENPYEVPELVKSAVVESVESAVSGSNRYPNDNFLSLREHLANYIYTLEKLRFSADSIIAANGSNEIMLEIFQAFGGPGRACLSFSPAYSMYPQFCRDSFTTLVEVPRVPDKFTIDIEKAVKQIQETAPSIIIITNPNNPTGTYTCTDNLRKILQAAENTPVKGADADARAVVIVDEAYSDFRDSTHETSLKLMSEFPNLLVVKTLSKAFAFAGVRLGFAIASPDIIRALRIVRLPYNLSTITQAVVIAALKHAPEMLGAVEEIKRERLNMFDQLKYLKYQGEPFLVVPSQANFIQVGFSSNLPNYQQLPEELHAYMLKNGVLIRRVGAPGYFRVTIGKPQENEHFITILKLWLNN